jgi:hypothetical protein
LKLHVLMHAQFLDMVTEEQYNWKAAGLSPSDARALRAEE